MVDTVSKEVEVTFVWCIAVLWLHEFYKIFAGTVGTFRNLFCLRCLLQFRGVGVRKDLMGSRIESLKIYVCTSNVTCYNIVADNHLESLFEKNNFTYKPSLHLEDPQISHLEDRIWQWTTPCPGKRSHLEDPPYMFICNTRETYIRSKIWLLFTTEWMPLIWYLGESTHLEHHIMYAKSDVISPSVGKHGSFNRFVFSSYCMTFSWRSVCHAAVRRFTLQSLKLESHISIPFQYQPVVKKKRVDSEDKRWEWCSNMRQ